jgi:hypothetical protein
MFFLAQELLRRHFASNSKEDFDVEIDVGLVARAAGS